jgi:hypothetical protein
VDAPIRAAAATDRRAAAWRKLMPPVSCPSAVTTSLAGMVRRHP